MNGSFGNLSMGPSYWLGEGGAPKLANLVTFARGIAIMPIVALLFGGHPSWALGLYVAAALTDAIDGWLARRSARASAFGARLDAVVDNVFSLAILAFLLLAYPDLAGRHPIALAVLFVGPIAYLVLSWALTRRLMMYHFASAKLGGLLLFSLWPAIAITGWQWLVVVAAAFVGASRLEQVVFMLRGGTDLDAPHFLAPIDAFDRRS